MVTTATPPNGLACAADRVFDGLTTRADCAVLVDGGKVSGLCAAADIPDGRQVFRFPGCTIIPGLIDTHIHFMRWQGPGYLAHGVTTIRDTGNDLAWILERRREAHLQLWPRILCLGPLLEGPTPYHKCVARGCASAAEGVAAVNATLDAGTDGVKFYVGLPVDWLPDMVRACHERGSKASIHCGGSGLRATMRSGVDEFYHLDGVLRDVWRAGPLPGWLDGWGDPRMRDTWDEQQRLADDIRAAGITATPTLAYWDSQWRVRTPQGHGEIGSELTPDIITRWQSPPSDTAMSDRWRRALDAALRFTGLLIERGVPVLAGTDVPCGAVPPGLSLWRELRYLCEAGMSPVKALQAATAHAAAFLGRSELGHLRPGSAADLAVVRGNPLDAIPEHPNIEQVMRNGVLEDQGTLLERARHPLSGGLLNAGLDPQAPDPWVAQFQLHYANTPQGKSEKDGKTA